MINYVKNIQIKRGILLLAVFFVANLVSGKSGNLHNQVGKVAVPESEEFQKTAKEVDPISADLLKQIDKLVNVEKKYQEALGLIDAQLPAHADNHKLWGYKRLAHERLNDSAGALASLKKYVEKYEKYLLGNLNYVFIAQEVRAYGRMVEKLKGADAAIKEVKRFAPLVYQDQESHNYFDLVSYAMEMEDKAKGVTIAKTDDSEYEHALSELKPNVTQKFEGYAKSGDQAAYEACLDSLLCAYPSDPPILSFLSRHYKKLGLEAKEKGVIRHSA